MDFKYWLSRLVTRLLLGFVAGGLLAGGLLLAGDQLLKTSTLRFERTLSEHVRPLAILHRLQLRIDNLRNLELATPRIRDFFAVAEHLTRLQAETTKLDSDLNSYIAALTEVRPGDAMRLAGHWGIYRTALGDLVRSAEAMDMASVERISNTRSQAPYAAIEEILSESVRLTETAAETAYRQTVGEQEGLRRRYLYLSIAAFVVLAAGLAGFGRSLAGRISRLREGAHRLAAGEGHGSIEVDGRDEIAELGHAFNTMQDKVAAREQALLAAQEMLEQRVEARTRALKDSNERLKLLSQAVEQSPVGVLIATAEGVVQYVNAAYTTITGKGPELLLGQQLAAVIDAVPVKEEDPLGAALTGGRDWDGERRARRRNGSDYWEHVRLQSVSDESGQLTHRLLTREDVTPRRERDEKIAYQAHYDTLTGLPNRTLAFDRLAQATGHAERASTRTVIMFIDLDNFKQVNDTLGHAAGDLLLQQAARRLQASVRKEDSVARLGGDEFLVMLGGLEDEGAADTVAAKIVRAFAAPFDVDGRELATSPSIGIAVYPDDGTDPAVLLRNADLAMYEAKEAGRNTYRFFNQAIHDASMQRLELERCLRGALERHELYLHYQPLVSAATGAVVGAEALLRWNSPELGRVGPDRFIPIAEQCGLIVGIGEWVLREACAQAARWRALQPEFTIAVNVSPRQFWAGGFVETVHACIGEFGIPEHRLELEVTEGLLIRNQNEARALLDSLDGYGAALSMDDFGTGYSSLSYLRAFPFSTVKIDRSFIRDVGEDKDDRALVVAAIRMAKALGLKVIAEGVETELQRDFLAAHDCEVLQGFLFGRPVGAGEFEATWLAQRTTAASCTAD